VLHLRNRWAQLTGFPVSEQIGLQQIDLQQTDLQQNIKQSDRHRQAPGAQPLEPLSDSVVGQRRRPASAILAVVAGRL
jgi:hypothetical protein